MRRFSDEDYDALIGNLFKRFPSFQKAGAGAYKPGTGNMEFMDGLMGHPHRRYKVIHVAGTNGKGSVSNMLASVLASFGLKVGLYTSPHILDFRERMRVLEGVSSGARLIDREYVWEFVGKWSDVFDHVGLSFFEITTSMAMDWFASEEVDVAVLETGLGGRLDSTNIVMPVMSVVTNIGLDHCDLLGETLPEIAFEKAGIIKPGVPAVVGESDVATDEIFVRKVMYVNGLSLGLGAGDVGVDRYLTFADRVDPSLWDEAVGIIGRMDLRGDYQKKNLRTVLAALDVLRGGGAVEFPEDWRQRTVEAIVSTAARTGFRGRWEKVSDDPMVICDIGHNEHGLKYNFAQLEAMAASGEVSALIMVYGSVADKDIRSVIPLVPEGSVCIFTQSKSLRSLPAERICALYREMRPQSGNMLLVVEDVKDAVDKALEIAENLKDGREDARPLIYIGGSTYVVSEAIDCF